MGIRVNPEILLKQLDLCHVPERKEFVWHQMLLDGTLPQTIGGGIGQVSCWSGVVLLCFYAPDMSHFICCFYHIHQSRTCQFLLRACHIGEVQHGWYNPAEVEVLKKDGINLLGLGEFEADPHAKST